MDHTSDKQWLHDISHVGMRMGNLVKEISEIKEHVESYYLSSPLIEMHYTGVDAKHLVYIRVVLTHLQ